MEKAEQRIEYVYDYMFRRISKKIYSGTSNNWVLTSEIRFIYNGYLLVAEYSVSSATQSIICSYVWGLDLSHSLQGGGGIGGLLSLTISPLHNPTTSFLCYDANGNVTEYIGDSCSVMAHYEYGLYGNIIVKNGESADTLTFRSSTKFFDRETGVYYYGYRYFSSVLGRWLSRDPIEEKNQFNLYVFCRNAPIAEFDILGLASVTEKQCKDTINNAWKKSNKIAKLVENMKKHKPRPCNIPVVRCGCCKDPESLAEYSDTGNRGKGSITMCYKKIPSETELLTIYLHELTHAWNECNGFGGESCDEAVCDEILAYYYDGNCEPKGDPSFGDKSKWDCVIRRAADSAESFCGGDNLKARKRGWALLKDCLKKAPKPF